MNTLIAAAVAGILGVAATLLGGSLSARASKQAQKSVASLARMNDYVLTLRSSVAEFCTATMIYRGAESDRWYIIHTAHAGSSAEEAADARVRETRTSARNALYHVELSTGSPAIHSAVREAFSVTKSIKDAETAAESSALRDEVEAKLDVVARLTRLELGVEDVPVP